MVIGSIDNYQNIPIIKITLAIKSLPKYWGYIALYLHYRLFGLLVYYNL